MVIARERETKNPPRRRETRRKTGEAADGRRSTQIGMVWLRWRAGTGFSGTFSAGFLRLSVRPGVLARAVYWGDRRRGISCKSSAPAHIWPALPPSRPTPGARF